jgi:GTP-binding protein
LTEKPEIVALNKADAMSDADIEQQVARLKRAAKTPPFVVSAATGRGVKDVLRALLNAMQRMGADAPSAAPDGWNP